LQRVIEKEVVAPLAFFLNRNPQLRETTVTVDFDTLGSRVVVALGEI
jgi:hypothetical protein